jgi:hypothetical protein
MASVEAQIIERVKELATSYGSAEAVEKDQVLAADDLADLLSILW